MPGVWRKRERSFTYPNYSKILHHCHQMFRSISHHPSAKNSDDVNAATNESIASTQRRKSIPRNFLGNHRSIKKAFSLIFNRVDSTVGDPVDATEMHEFVRCTTSEENLNTFHRSTSNIPDDAIFIPRSSCPVRRCTTAVHHKFFPWKNKFKCRYRPTDYNHDKNEGFLVVDNPDSEPVLLRNDNLDHQQTQHAQPCVQINDTGFDLNQIQFSSVTPLRETSLDVYLPSSDIRLSHELEIQATRRSGVECEVSQDDFSNVQDTRMSHMVSIASPSSTNSSSHEYTDIDRSVLDDIEYVRAQELDLFRLIDAEIDLCKDRSYLQQDLEDEEEFLQLYHSALKENLQLQEELNELQERNQRSSSWSCELCTFINIPLTETDRNIYVCDICEGPSPLRRATLIQ